MFSLSTRTKVLGGIAIAGIVGTVVSMIKDNSDDVACISVSADADAIDDVVDTAVAAVKDGVASVTDAIASVSDQ